MRLLVGLAAAVVAVTSMTATASSGESWHAMPHHRVVSVGANKSNNWSGYNQGALEKHKTFHQVSATWKVPTAAAHRAGENEYSSTWVGIGGGCVDARCSLTDSTLIQAGTEQDGDSRGHASYSTWWEAIPAPSGTTSLPAKPAGTGCGRGHPARRLQRQGPGDAVEARRRHRRLQRLRLRDQLRRQSQLSWAAGISQPYVSAPAPRMASTARRG